MAGHLPKWRDAYLFLQTIYAMKQTNKQTTSVFVSNKESSCVTHTHTNCIESKSTSYSEKETPVIPKAHTYEYITMGLDDNNVPIFTENGVVYMGEENLFTGTHFWREMAVCSCQGQWGPNGHPHMNGPGDDSRGSRGSNRFFGTRRSHSVIGMHSGGSEGSGGGFDFGSREDSSEEYDTSDEDWDMDEGLPLKRTFAVHGGSGKAVSIQCKYDEEYCAMIISVF